MSKYSERLEIYKAKRDAYNDEFTISGSGCLFHNEREFNNFSDVDDDPINSLEAIF
ncbi:MAG: hypothetical protein KAS36_03860 [Anaerolineales bacterium]|nr:hypothetical protein [Anaerolineales bacterium]